MIKKFKICKIAKINKTKNLEVSKKLQMKVHIRTYSNSF